MSKAICSDCGAETSIRKYFSEGWLRIVLTYTDNQKRRIYYCAACRAKPGFSVFKEPEAPKASDFRNS